MIRVKTIILDAEKPDNIQLCADTIKKGGLVAFPTETVYGLGANALDKKSVDKIFYAKGRQNDNPLIVHVASLDDVKPLVVDIPHMFETLAKQYWPGPLTLIMKKNNKIPANVTSGLDTVAIRIPAHPAALAFIQACGCPVAAPSANPSGKPSPTKAQHVMSDIGGKIPYILDGGDCKIGIESTVLDITGHIPAILRPGGVTYNELINVLGVVDNCRVDEVDAPLSPGMKYRHYAPKTPLTAVIGSPKKTTEYIIAHMDDNAAALMFDDFTPYNPKVVSFGHSEDHAAQASRLFDALRRADNLGAGIIYAQVPVENGIGLAVGNRIKKAAGKNIIVII